jgi:zinc transporter 1/2/3
MVLFYTLSTAIGIAIGIGLHETYNDNGKTTLISTGILEAISTGILIYDGLVLVVVPHFQGKAYVHTSVAGKMAQFGCLWLGALAMAIVGKWA